MTPPRITDWSLSDAELYVDEDGNVSGLYTEAVDLGAVGTLHVRKLSSVDWTPAGWEVRLNAGGVLGVYPTRIKALEAETKWFNDRIEAEGRP